VDILETIFYELRKHVISDKGFKATVVNRTLLPSLNGGKLEITLTVPLSSIYVFFGGEYQSLKQTK